MQPFSKSMSPPFERDDLVDRHVRLRPETQEQLDRLLVLTHRRQGGAQ
jgi:hypothetical protein